MPVKTGIHVEGGGSGTKPGFRRAPE